MSAIRQWLHRFLFSAMPAARLGWIRIITGGYILVILARGRASFLRVSRSSPDLFEPVGLATFLDGPVSPALFETILWVTIVLGLTFVVGFWHRFLGPAFALCLLWVLSYRLSWGMVYRVHHLVTLHILILGFVPAAAAVSVDAWLSRRSSGPSFLRLGIWPGLPDGPHWRFGWPVQLLCLVTTIAYSLAGLAKITGPGGWGWALGNNLRNNVAHDALAKELMKAGGASDWVELAFAAPSLMVIAGFLTLILELFAPLFLVHRRVAQVWVVMVICMHLWIRILMDLTFVYLTFGFAFISFFAIERAFSWLGSRQAPSQG